MARPIISYHGFMFARLFKALAIVLHSLCKLVLPHSFGLASLPELFRSLHVIFDAAPADSKLEMMNQDLVGFFTSIPVDRILRAVAYVLQEYKCRFQKTDTDCFSIDLQETNSTLRIFQGRPRKAAARQHSSALGDVLRSFEASNFVQLRCSV